MVTPEWLESEATHYLNQGWVGLGDDLNKAADALRAEREKRERVEAELETCKLHCGLMATEQEVKDQQLADLREALIEMRDRWIEYSRLGNPTAHLVVTNLVGLLSRFSTSDTHRPKCPYCGPYGIGSGPNCIKTSDRRK